MKPIQSTLIAATLLFGSVAHAQSTFADVPDNHWAAAAVKTLAEAGIVEGFPAQAESGAKVGATPMKAKTVASAKVDPALEAAIITPKVKAALVANAALRGATINVDTMSCCKTVTLEGSVRSAAQKQLAGAIAKKHAAKYQIVNDLKIASVKTAQNR